MSHEGPKSNRTFIERHKINAPSTQIHDRSLSWIVWHVHFNEA